MDIYTGKYTKIPVEEIKGIFKHCRVKILQGIIGANAVEHHAARQSKGTSTKTVSNWINKK